MEIVEATDQKEWDIFITSHEEANFLQSWDFYVFHEKRGKKVVRRIVTEKNKIIAAYAGVIETAKRGKHLAIAGGPILDWKNEKVIKMVFADIKRQSIDNDCVFARVRPQLELSNNSLKMMQKLGLKKSPIYLSVEYAGVLDLNKTEDEILANASQGLRRKIRKAQKSDIIIETSTDPKIVKTFYKLEIEHAKRQKFIAFSEDFLTKQFSAFSEHDEAIMYTAKLGKEVLAQNFMIFYGNEASYHYGTSSELGNKYSAAPLLHLAAMEEARKRKIQRYNFWGIVGPDETKHRFYGVSSFKRSFGVAELKYTPAHDLIIDSKKYLITKTIESTRKKIRHV